MGDIVEYITKQGFKPDSPYPDGVYTCALDYSFPSKSAVRFGLRLERVAAPGWQMTFVDVSDDLEALYYAALWFEEGSGKVPEMDLEIYRYKSGSSGATFFASRGRVAFALGLEGNVTST